MLEDTIYQDYVTAMKAKDKPKAQYLSFIRAALKNCAIDAKKEKLDDTEALDVLAKQKKRLLDTKESLISAGREEMIPDTERELEYLSAYLPEPMSEAELITIIDEIVAETGASSMKDMGNVMKSVKEKVGMRAEPKKVSELVRQKLTSA